MKFDGRTLVFCDEKDQCKFNSLNRVNVKIQGSSTTGIRRLSSSWLVGMILVSYNLFFWSSCLLSFSFSLPYFLSHPFLIVVSTEQVKESRYLLLVYSLLRLWWWLWRWLLVVELTKVLVGAQFSRLHLFAIATLTAIRYLLTSYASPSCCYIQCACSRELHISYLYIRSGLTREGGCRTLVTPKNEYSKIIDIINN